MKAQMRKSFHLHNLQSLQVAHARKLYLEQHQQQNKLPKNK